MISKITQGEKHVLTCENDLERCIAGLCLAVVAAAELLLSNMFVLTCQIYYHRPTRFEQAFNRHESSQYNGLPGPQYLRPVSGNPPNLRFPQYFVQLDFPCFTLVERIG